MKASPHLIYKPELFSSLTDKAKQLGFAAVGFMETRVPPHFEHFMEWLAENKCGQLTWLQRNADLRKDPRRLLEGCRTIISLAMDYPAEQARTPDGFTIARYASSPLDYHVTLKGLCRELADVVRNAFPHSRCRIFVDSAPILERSIAYGAGLGFIGKNNMLIVPGHGSYVNLAEILTTAPIDFEVSKVMESRCGDCNRCIQACPTGAVERPFSLNVPRCLAYMSVEYRGEFKEGQGKIMGKCFLGCDRCQEVCPLNNGGEAKLLSLPSTEEFLEMDEPIFSARFGVTALARPGLARVKRNILAIMRDSPQPFVPG